MTRYNANLSEKQSTALANNLDQASKYLELHKKYVEAKTERCQAEEAYDNATTPEQINQAWLKVLEARLAEHEARMAKAEQSRILDKAAEEAHKALHR